MSKTSHTPGPWKAFFTTDGKKVLGVGDAEGGGIAALWLDGKEQAANAHLIAAAPDLYAALMALRDDKIIQAVCPSPLWGKMVDALTKARGQA